MKDIQKIKEFFSKPLKEVSGDINIEDFNKVVQAIEKTNYPVTVMLTSMFGNEIEIIVGMDAPDSLINAISDIMDNLGYNSSKDYSIAGDSSTLSRRQYSEIRKINGGHNDYYEESMLSEDKTAIDMAKEQLDALGVKYEMSGNKFKPFKVIYKPTQQSDRWYDKFDEIIDLFNLASAVKQSMNEANGFKSGKEFINIKLRRYPKAVAKINQLIDMIGEPNFTMEMAEWIWDFFNNASFERPVYEASKEEETEFHKKLDTLVHNTFGKRKGELEEAKSFTLDSYSASDSDKITDFLTSNDIKFTKIGPKIKISLDRDTPKASVILSKLRSLSKFDELNEAELSEAYVPSNIKEFAKRKGVTALVNKVAKWAEEVGAGIRGGTAIGKNYDTLVLDMTSQGSEIYINTDDNTITLFDEPVRNFNEFQRVYSDGQGFNLEEIASKVLSKLKESKSTPCWKGYEQIGMKEKDGRQVPNCVPKK